MLNKWHNTQYPSLLAKRSEQRSREAKGTHSPITSCKDFSPDRSRKVSEEVLHCPGNAPDPDHTRSKPLSQPNAVAKQRMHARQAQPAYCPKRPYPTTMCSLATCCSDVLPAWHPHDCFTPLAMLALGPDAVVAVLSGSRTRRNARASDTDVHSTSSPVTTACREALEFWACASKR